MFCTECGRKLNEHEEITESGEEFPLCDDCNLFYAAECIDLGDIE